MPREPLQYIQQRLDATIDVQEEIQEHYELNSWSLVAMKSDRDAITAKVRQVMELSSDEDALRRELERPHDDPHGSLGLIDELHQATKALVTTGKNDFHADTAKHGRWRNLTAGGQSRRERMREAQAALIAWENSDVDWTPTKTLHLDTFRALFAQSGDELRALGKAESDTNEARHQLDRLANALLDKLIAWYNNATAANDADTDIGAQVRRQITTTYTPHTSAPQPPPPPVIEQESMKGNDT